MDSASAEVAESDKRNGGFAGRLRVARGLANILGPLADEMDDLGSRYASTLVEVDPGILTMIRLLEETDPSDKTELEQAQELFRSIDEFATISGDNVATIATFIDTLASIGQFDRGLGRQTRKIKRALQKIVDGQAVMDGWKQRIASTGVLAAQEPASKDLSADS